jgi:hypothetical protein
MKGVLVCPARHSPTLPCKKTNENWSLPLNLLFRHVFTRPKNRSFPFKYLRLDCRLLDVREDGFEYNNCIQFQGFKILDTLVQLSGSRTCVFSTSVIPSECHFQRENWIIEGAFPSLSSWQLNYYCMHSNGSYTSRHICMHAFPSSILRNALITLALSLA